MNYEAMFLLLLYTIKKESNISVTASSQKKRVVKFEEDITRWIMETLSYRSCWILKSENLAIVTWGKILLYIVYGNHILVFCSHLKVL